MPYIMMASHWRSRSSVAVVPVRTSMAHVVPVAHLAAVLLLQQLPLSGATVYYVGCGAGDADSNAGTSEGAGWRTLARVNAAKLHGGDSVLFRRGCQWRGGYLTGQSGLPGRPVTFGAFGGLDSELPRPQ
eukprot:SAG22_NODE_7329_length_751_cov_1.159509_2_plen_129_part_01